MEASQAGDIAKKAPTRQPSRQPNAPARRREAQLEDAEAYVRAGDVRDVLDVTAARRRGRIRANLGLL
jgi:hypothetical protein